MKPIRGDLARLDDAQRILGVLTDRHQSPNLNEKQRAWLRDVHLMLADVAEALEPHRLVSP